MIKNVNLLQNPIDINEYSKEYTIQALANLGQRIGIKGDGISYKHFSFADLLDSTTKYSQSNHIGFIKYLKSTDNNYTGIFGVSKIDTETGKIIESTTLGEELSINDCLYFPNDLEFDIPISGIEKYSKNSICINNGEDLTMMLAAKIMGTIDNDQLNTILYYYKFDINTNLLKYASKIYHYKTDNLGEWFCMLTTVNSAYKENNYVNNVLSDEYEMTINIFNANTLKGLNGNNSLYDDFLNLFKFSNYSRTNNLPFSIIRSEYDNLQELLNYNDDVNFNYFSNSAISVIKNFNINSPYEERTIKLSYNTVNNEYLSINNANFENVIKFYKNEYKLNLNEELFLLNEECKTLYYNVFNYYNEKFYFSSHKEFVKRILLKIYEKISNKDYSNEYVLYVPLNYQFSYICNSNDNMYIYYSTNINVSHINIDNIDLEDFWKENTNLVYNYDDNISKVKTYNFEINYNSNNEKIINYVKITDIFTMPYINANYNWSINDIDTKIKAIGADAGNPNIIIVYNKNKEEEGCDKSYFILNSIANIDLIKESNFKYESFYVNPALFNNSPTLDILCCAYVPEVTDKNFEVFKDSVILSISDLDCLEDSSLKTDYKGSYILTMWCLKKGIINYKFECITNVGDTEENNKYALALGSTINIFNETNDNTIANLNGQDLILLKAPITKLGQENLALNANNWVIIKNKISEEYADTYDSESEYVNDLNGIIQYNDTINIKNNNLEHSQTGKYISSIRELSITNALYPKYGEIITTKSKEIEEILNYIESDKNIDKTILDRISKIYVENESITNVESLIEELKAQYRLGTASIQTEIETQSVEQTNFKYDEYIFNDNIPNLDLGEIFIRNFNLLNRLNIISLSKNGLAYNAYLGTSFDDTDKSILHLGTSPTNINIGSETLMDEVDKRSFNEHDTLSLDFNNIILNSNKTVKSNNDLIVRKVINGIEYNIINVNLIGNCVSQYSDLNGNNNLFLVTNNNVDTIANMRPFVMSLHKFFLIYFNINLQETYNEIIVENVTNLSNENDADVRSLADMCYRKFENNSNNKYDIMIYFNEKYQNKIEVINNELENTNAVYYCGFTFNVMYYVLKDELTNNLNMHIYLNIN